MRVTHTVAAVALAAIAVWNARVGWELQPSQPEEALGNFLGSALLLACSAALAWHGSARPQARRDPRRRPDPH
ncbi:hypothetical protein [Mitsuaria sp. 7]|uniref:hypothetical protein n=1 Tax=Mitsuaria sp. 7 TaxID=1658665 RepID=UPI0007DD0996|nr:hypothetical protein [Mitsuaria sp. 7]ANH67090.1 hypothetical protein ABE85_05030 [Mitsuaria sp. 7]